MVMGTSSDILTDITNTRTCTHCNSCFLENAVKFRNCLGYDFRLLSLAHIFIFKKILNFFFVFMGARTFVKNDIDPTALRFLFYYF